MDNLKIDIKFIIEIIMNNYVYDDEGFFRVTEIFVYGSGKRD